ncbi:DNA replication/repair protein RecF [Candidatus Peregrinibacteria bacterium]|jgi:DNA replication and repair protein RecF|nr:DNA replication/repair protein RecF [Candidatus Peregrinibacteria bacterium]
MKLLKLQLQNFRNYDKYNLEFDESNNIFILLGENGKGKTNILESIFMLSTGKTFRNVDQDSMIKWGFDFFTTKGEIQENPDDETTEIEVSYSNYPRKQKIFKINEVSKKHYEYLGNFITVIFHPKDINLLYLEPSLRRKYLNLLLAQTDKYYLEALSNYHKIKKQRNALLDEISEGTKSVSELDVWDEKIAKEGTFIIEKRQKFVDFLNKKIKPTYRKISGGKEEIFVKYKSQISTETEEELLDNYLRKLKLKRDKDIRYGTTSLGPHRDDIEFYLDDHLFHECASRGEARTLIISLKISEITFIEKETKSSPILLLDDVFSELDENRQKHLFEAIKNCQTIITAAEKSHIKAAESDSKTIHL